MRSRMGWTSTSTVTGATASRHWSAGRNRIGRIAAGAVTALLVGALVPGAMAPASAAVVPSALLTNGFPASYGDGSVNLGLGPMAAGEGFYFNATATGGNATGGKLEVYEAALEGTYATAPAETIGQEIAFSRVRIRVTGLDAGQTYTITHPYGVDTFVATADTRSINSTIDVGCVAVPCDFNAAGAGFLGDHPGSAGFLKQAGALAGTLGDPLVAHPVTGAPSGTNAVIISGPNAGGPNVNTLTVSDFTVQGQIVAPAPTASFTTSVASGTAPLTVAMTDTSTDIPTSWAWDFGNTTTSTVQNPSATYAEAGTYTVTLTATNASGASTPVTQTIVVAPPVTTTPTTPPTDVPPTTPPTDVPPTTPPTDVPPTIPPTEVPPTTPPTTPSAARIRHLSSSHAEVGDKVVITGKGFGKAGVVKFGNVSSTALSWTDTRIVVRVPRGDYSRRVLVTVIPANGVASKGITFRIEADHKDRHRGHNDRHHESDCD